MRRIAFILMALAGLLTVGISPAAAAGTPTWGVSYATFQAATNAPSACAVVVPDVSYVIPVSDAVADEVADVSRYGYHSITGVALINYAFPGQILVANKTRSGVYPPHEYHVFIPGFQGRSCSQWVHLVAQG